MAVAAAVASATAGTAPTSPPPPPPSRQEHCGSKRAPAQRSLATHLLLSAFLAVLATLAAASGTAAQQSRFTGEQRQPNNPVEPKTPSRDKIVFPEDRPSGPGQGPNQGSNQGPNQGPGSNPISGNMPPPCARPGATYCEDVPNYPTKRVSDALENSVAFSEFFDNDTFPEPVGERFGGETTMCAFKEKLIFPKIGQNKNDDWIFIVNLDDQYQQGIHVELCVDDGGKCLQSQNFPTGTVATCRQKYVYRKLLAVNSNGDPQVDSFRIPSCCVCFLDTVSSRIGDVRGNRNARRLSRRSIKQRH